MVVKGLTKFQIGKNGITEGVLDSLRLSFKTRKVVRISVLRNFIRDKEKIKEMALKISEKLDNKEHKYKYKIIGFTIVLRKTFRKF